MKFTLEKIEQFVVDAGSDDLGTFGGKFEGGIHIQQIPDEIAPCILKILESGGAKSYLEIGVAAGGTTYLFNHFFHPEITIIDDNKHHKAKFRKTVLKGVERKELIGRSDDENILKTASESTYDIILIDGDHLYPGVKLDTIFYKPLLNPGGFLIYHDSLMKEWGVQRIVKELKTDESMEFISEYTSKKHSPLGVALFRRIK